MIGIMISVDLSDSGMDSGLLYRFSKNTPLEHLAREMGTVEAAHRIIICFKSSDYSAVSGTIFKDPLIKQSSLMISSRHRSSHSIKPSAEERIYDACVEHGITYAVVVDASDFLTPAYLVKDLIMESENGSKCVIMEAFPEGIKAYGISFSELSNIIRFKKFDNHAQENELRRDSVSKRIQNTTIPNTRSLRLTKKEQIPLFDAIFDGLASSDLEFVLGDLSELL